MKIALDAAKGLAFLHSEKVNVIHGNFNTSNILIDSVSGFILILQALIDEELIY